MTQGRTAIRTLQAEVDSAIIDIKDAAPAAKCAAHEPLARGVVALLRVESVRLEMQDHRIGEKRGVVLATVGKVASWAITAALGAAMATAWGLGK